MPTTPHVEACAVELRLAITFDFLVFARENVQHANANQVKEERPVDQTRLRYAFADLQVWNSKLNNTYEMVLHLSIIVFSRVCQVFPNSSTILKSI